MHHSFQSVNVIMKHTLLCNILYSPILLSYLDVGASLVVLGTCSSAFFVSEELTAAAIAALELLFASDSLIEAAKEALSFFFESDELVEAAKAALLLFFESAELVEAAIAALPLFYLSDELEAAAMAALSFFFESDELAAMAAAPELPLELGLGVVGASFCVDGKRLSFVV